MTAGEAGLDASREAIVIEVARRGDDHVAGQVMGVEEGPDLRHRDLGHDVRLAEHLASERVVREHGGGELLLHHVGGLVAVHQDLFEDHLALRIDLFGP